MICPSCNAPNRDDAKFCKKCGQSFRVGARFTAPEAPVGADLSHPSPKVSEAPVGADLSRPSPIYRPAPTQENVNAAEDPAFAPTQIISPQQM
ncbi:MAG TPA: zinc ribbon domain-containing protein, partial [Ktedonobacteraceae bacterium]|nr:zinc ribbon domain-containing protein [Ktedonobacteraceae bacterium]